MTKSPLEEMGTPLYFIADNAEEAGFPAPPNPHGQSLRTWVRALDGMQKEALVVSAATGTAWRFCCDEGANLGGHDIAPNPLTYLSAGMIASYMNEITALAGLRRIELRDPALVLQNFYYREGDFRKGTMNSSAMAPELSVACEASCDDAALSNLLYDAIAASPLNGLAHGSHPSLFTLIHNGNVLTPDQVTPLETAPPPNPGDNFPKLRRAEDSPAVPSLIEKMPREGADYDTLVAARVDHPDPGPGRQLLHMHSRCTLRPDGVKEIHKEQYSPGSPVWTYLSDEGEGFGGHGRAPDAASLISAGIGLCFMTQLGRYAHMAKLPLTGYSIIQDTHFSLGGASGGTGQKGIAKAVETHVYLETDSSDDVAQELLGVAERTCFLHAFCRDDIKPRVRAASPSRAA